mmetsp:Transcript_26176/g.36002  ORF Transcript_26176/g.36002 Transcript_26176/m.36002 type:complete len:549 (-) Transcript_26176:1826-3472(-)
MKEIWIWTHPSLVRQVAAELRTHMTDLFTELNTTSTSINRFSLKGPTSATVLKYLIGPGPSPLIDAKSSESFSFFHQATQCTQLSAIWPPGIALAINIPDPRFQSSLFQRSISPMNANKKTNKILWPSEANASILWDSSMTAMIADAFRSDFVVNREKKAYVKAAWQAHFVEKDASKVVDDRILENSFNSPFVPKSPNESVYCPALLIRQEQKVSKRLMRQRSKDSLLSGWDIIVPAVWGRTIWKALQKPFMIDSCTEKAQLERAFAVGEDEMQDIRRMKGILSFPRDYPFTEAGEAYWARRHSEALRINNKRPPGKRNASLTSLAYLLHNIVAWNPSITMHTKKEEDVFSSQSIIAVIGETHLRDFLPPDECQTKSNVCVENVPRDLIASGALKLPCSLLLIVQLQPSGARGLPMDLASIYPPSPEDYLAFATACQTRKERKQTNKNSSKSLVDRSQQKRKLWNGTQLAKNSAEVNKQVIGVVTSGYKPHTNQLMGRKNSSCVIALLNAAALNHLFCNSFGQYQQESTSHRFVLFRNPNSGWLVKIM